MRLQSVFDEFCARRKGILRALTTEVDAFAAAADPNRENLCLFGNPDASWTVAPPAEEVPPEIPEPALGINFARDGMQRKDWLALVAVHSDSWLLALAFYKGARLNKDQRDELFGLINGLPTCYEVVSGKAKNMQPSQQQHQQHNHHQQRKRAHEGAGGQPPRARAHDDDDEDDDDGWHDGDGDPCPGCKRLYRTDEFWIACDRCDIWWCGRCSKMTEKLAEVTPSWQCARCR